MASTPIHADSALTRFEERCLALLGRGNVRRAGDDDSVCGVLPTLVVEPGTEQEVARVLQLADEQHLAVLPRGGGTKLGWGNPPSGADILLSTARLNRVLAHAWSDLTVTVEAGCTVERLQQTLAQHGQRLAVDVLWPERATVGGVLSTNDSGGLRLRFGGLRDLVIGVTLALADGTLASSGGRVVKNVAGYDLQKLAAGALGTLGLITQATFRVHPLPQTARTLTLRVAEPASLQPLLLAIQDSQLAHAALQVRLSPDAAPEADILLEGTEAGLAAQEVALREIAADVAADVGDSRLWRAREELCEALVPDSLEHAIAKLAILPSNVGSTATAINDVAKAHELSWRAVLQATGIGWVRLDGNLAVLPALRELRSRLARRGGSLVVVRQPPSAAPLDAWGEVGDALPLMRALKRQLDPRGTLNPGRFVGGI